MKIELSETSFKAIENAQFLHSLIKIPLRTFIIVGYALSFLFMIGGWFVFYEEPSWVMVIGGGCLLATAFLYNLEFDSLISHSSCGSRLSFEILLALQSRKVKEAYWYSKYILDNDKCIVKEREKRYADLLFFYLAIGHRGYLKQPYAELEWMPCNVIYTSEQEEEIKESRKSEMESYNRWGGAK